jgi:TPR repeat protein
MKAAEKGDMQSQVNVANAYYLGDGTELDHHKAFLWYREAAFQGHVLSQKNVGAAFWNGDGVEKDLSECVFLYELAANGGDAQAQFATGWFLMTGTGVPIDEKKGLKWIHKATFQGYQPAIDYCKEHGYKWY